MDRLERILVERLTAQGMQPDNIPGFIRDLVNSMELKASQSLLEINERLHLLGWYDVDLDYHTLQLILAAYVREPNL